LLATLFLPAMAYAKLNVVATLPDLAAIAREIGGDKIEATSIGKAGEDPHFVQAKPGYIVMLNRADVLIENGLDLEIGWLPALLDQTRNPKIRPGAPGRIVAAEGVPLLERPAQPVTRAMGDVHPGGNPHFLLDPERGKIAAKNICDGLSRVDPKDADEFRANLETFNRRVDEAMAGWQTLLAPFRGAHIVTYHRSMSYLAERFGLNVINTIEPKPGIPPSPSHLAELIEQMKAHNVKVILMEVWHERRTPALVAQKTGARLLEVPTQSAGDYLSVCDGIVKQLAAALR
jgi:zinc/manganese transport system substrate-binding protein